MKTGEYTPTIGLEIHAELKTATKMFCGSRNDPFAGEPNTHVCPICMGHPGTLPVINKEAVKSVVTVGVALSGVVASQTRFDRKNYFYPDIPKGYQISQYEHPLVKGGALAGVSITRVHLEEDTAKSLHENNEGSLVDYNRAGVPLMELVTEPVIHDAKTAGNFARELQLLLRTLGISDANMEKGEMRVEANISVSKDPNALGTKVEVKNLNSFRSVEMAIDHEVARQIKALEKGEGVSQQTRGWDEEKKVTYVQREKESSHDYRYFPDPDLVDLDLDKDEDFDLSRLAENMPELPSQKRTKYANLGLKETQIETLILDMRLTPFFEKLIQDSNERDQKSDLLKLSANYLTSDILNELQKEGADAGLNMSVTRGFLDLMSYILRNEINSRVAKDMLADVVFARINMPDGRLILDQGVLQKNSHEALLPIVEEVVNENESVVLDVKNGKESALQFLVGQGMKKTKGSANPTLLLELFKKNILG